MCSKRLCVHMAETHSQARTSSPYELVPNILRYLFKYFKCVCNTPFIQIQQTRKGLPNADINTSILNGGKKCLSIYYLLL